MFLKAKNSAGQQTLLAVADISAVIATKDGGTTVSMKNGDVHETTLGIISVGNRLAELDVQVA